MFIFMFMLMFIKEFCASLCAGITVSKLKWEEKYPDFPGVHQPSELLIKFGTNHNFFLHLALLELF